MNPAPVLILLAIMAPHSGVYVKGHSRAAEKVRQNLESLTCYSSGDLNDSASILQVDHILANSGRSWIVIILTDGQQKVVWRGKAEEYPWPIPSPLDRMLKNMAKSTCPGYQSSHLRKPTEHQDHDPISRTQIPQNTLVQHSPN